ncbi:uncharacterized protein LOC107636058 [Arachis ipaensis]|uniref:uncharacterized protein LOC107636058 n=1 Tax=Arachis ipaensis TaxID=130454 RepID=UPI0007AEEBCF|nr:uncharacterized protein LOC107636058 [Arachis ipaensis]
MVSEQIVPIDPEDGLIVLLCILCVHPPTFRGTSNPTDADNWIQAIERALQAQQVPDEQWVEFGTYQLHGKAQHWWQGMRRILQLDGVVISWELFREEFYKKYFPNSGAPEDFAEWKYIKYEGGLQSDIQSFVAPLEIRVFSELVNKSRVAEECVKRANNQGQGNFRRPNTYANQGRRQGKQPQQDVSCHICGKYHSGPCKFGTGVCYSCGQPGHLANSCPEKKTYEMGRVQQPGRVYTTSAVGAEGSETLIRGNCEMTGKTLNALFDSGASHSFITFEKVDEL